MNNDLIKRNNVINDIKAWFNIIEHNTDILIDNISNITAVESKLILPERMERGDRYQVGETIVVMNRDDYYDLLCKSMKSEPKQGEWIEIGINEDNTHNVRCNQCGNTYKLFGHAESIYTKYNYKFCPHCGARMKKADN